MQLGPCYASFLYSLSVFVELFSCNSNIWIWTLMRVLKFAEVEIMKNILEQIYLRWLNRSSLWTSLSRRLYCQFSFTTSFSRVWWLGVESCAFQEAINVQVLCVCVILPQLWKDPDLSLILHSCMTRCENIK